MKKIEKLKNILKRRKNKTQPATHKTSPLEWLKSKLGGIQLTKENLAPLEKHAWLIVSLSTILLVSVLVFRNFLFTNEWPAGGDVLGWISRVYLYGNDFRWLQVWRPYSFGFVEIVNLLDFLLFLIHLLFQNGEATVKVFMFSSFLFAGVSVYVFAFRFTRKHVAALSASLVYLLNQWLISQLFEAHIEIIFSYAFAPLLFIFVDRALEHARLRDVLSAAIIVTIAVTAFHAEAIVIYGTFMALFSIFYLIIPTKNVPFKSRTKQLLKVYAPLLVIVFLLSSFVTLPFLMNSRPRYYSTSYAYSLDETYVYGYKNLADAFTLKSRESWGYILALDYATGIEFPGFPSIVLTFIFALAYCVLFVRRDRYTLFFAFSMILAVFMSMGPNPPFGDFFIWAWHNIPHFAVFRAISRWIMIAVLSHAFFVSLFVSGVIDYVERRMKAPVESVVFTVRASGNKNSFGRVYSVSVDAVNTVVRCFHKFLHRLSVLILLLIFAAPVLEGYYIVGNGLQVNTPPQSYLTPYLWVGSQAGNFKVVTVGQQPVDFADGAMISSLGWSHEYGADSSFLTDKPTLQDGGWESLSRLFVDYLRNRVVPYKTSDNFMKMLGAFGYRYLVIPSYASDQLREFFINQKQVHTVYNASGAVILENDFFSGPALGVTGYAVVQGDLESFISLDKIGSFNLNRTALLFTQQIQSPLLSNPWFTNSENLIFADSDFMDMLMLSLKENPGVIKPSKYGVNSFKSQLQWIQSSELARYGKILFDEKTLQTSGINSISIPFKTQSDGIFVFLARLGFTPYRGTLTIAIDGVKVKEIKPVTNGPSTLRWVNIGILNLKGGNHEITLSNDGTGPNDIDVLAMIGLDEFEQQKNLLTDTLNSFQGRIIHIIEPENTFTYNATGGWIYTLFPYTGFGLRLSEFGGNVALSGTASASSSFNGDYEPKYANDGLNTTRWASSAGREQWLKLEWPIVQELTGVQIRFEEALAEDYAVQTWNGTAWVNQITVTNNSQTKVYHRFLQPVNTTKLQISMNATALYDMVSMWEIETFSKTSSIFSRINPLRAGFYMVAFRLASGPDYGTIHVKLDNHTHSISCQQGTGFEWYEMGPFFLENHEHNLRIDCVGKIDFDSMLVYSVTENETLHSDELFENTNQKITEIEIDKISSVQYNVHVRSDGSFLLVFSESYHPLWRAYVGNEEFSPMIADFFVNCFFIDKSGEFTVVLYFSGQRFTDLGLKISLFTLLIIAGLFVTPTSAFRKLKTRLTRKRRQE
ncbi:MAG: discoidin domain-containing protein [Candidatus Bathyarchaeales archaeon]